jgi:Cupin-like domain
MSNQRFRKAVSILNALGQLAPLDSQSTIVERRSELGRDEFRDRYYAANRPIIIQGLMTDWRAATVWTPDYLKSVAGDQMVEIMADRDADPDYEINVRKHRRVLRFADYIDMVYGGKITNDYYLVANNRFFQGPAGRCLLKDFSPFAQYLNPAAVEKECHLWFGPAGTLTPLHHDTSNILVAQVAGRKRYKLISPSQWQHVYNNRGVFSDVNCENPNFDRYPKFRNATIIDLILYPGEVLFLPVAWWHHVRALDVSLSISFTNFLFPNDFTWE